MNTRITLKVKEGPGELIGITQIDAINNEIIFDKIQFSESGQYVISVISSSPDIENTELILNVNRQDEFIEQESSDQEEKKLTSENKPFITQIDTPTIDLTPMSLEITSNGEDNDRMLESFGRNPFFWYNGIQIQERFIIKLDLYYDGFIPRCKITFIDSIGVINSPDYMPLSDTKFEVFLNSNSNLLKPIHLRFKIETSQRNRNGTNTITGILDIPDFYKVNFRSYNSTSFDTLREVCKEHKLGFNSNIDQTNDQMNWIKNAINTKDFIKDVLLHSYISDNSFIQGYIDFYWAFNFVDIEKEWSRDNSEDVGINSTGISSELKKDDLLKLTPMILSNDKSIDNSGFGFKNYRITNNSTNKNSKKGTFTKAKYYDRISKRFMEFNIDSLDSDPTKNIILKGSPLDKSELENYRTKYSGKIDIDNTHENYLYAVIHNQRNLNNITNITIELELNELNFNLYRFQKITVIFVNQMQTIINDSKVNERLTGNWVVTDISFIFNGKETKQKLILARKELSKLIDEINNQVVEIDKNTNNSEINNNPIDSDNNIQLTQSNVTNSSLLEPLQSENSKFLSDSDIEEFALEFNLEIAVVKSVISVESSGSGFFSDGRAKILFEGHEFWRQLKKINIKPESISDTSNQDILYPKWVRTFYLKGANEYNRLNRAVSLLPNNSKVSTAALSSASWGLFQIMGYHAISMGYPSVEDFVQKMQTSEKEHLIAFGKFLKKNRLLDDLRKRNWSKFAKAYNGPLYAQNKYDEKLENSYLGFSKNIG